MKLLVWILYIQENLVINIHKNDANKQVVGNREALIISKKLMT